MWQVRLLRMRVIKVVTGNTVATAIQESGWNIGLADSSKANKAFDMVVKRYQQINLRK